MSTHLNPNDTVRIKPTKEGWLKIVRYVDEFNDHMRKNRPNAIFKAKVPEADKDGYIEGQFWSLMKYFGDWSIGSDINFSDMVISHDHH